VDKADESLKGIHRVSKKLADGSTRIYHYAFRGGPCFWNSSFPFEAGAPEYAEAFVEALKGPTAASRPSAGRSTADIVAAYRKSPQFINRKPRTKKDYEKFLTSFEAEFGEDPVKMFEEKESLSEINKWKANWAHLPKQYDYATSMVTLLLNWTMKEEAAIAVHHHVGMKRLYKSDRAEIIWLPGEVEALLAVANEREARIVVAASEGGMAPQDLGVLKREHIQRTPKGRRLFFKRTKSKKPTSIPVTPALAELIDATPVDQEYLVVSLEGHRLTPERASQIVRDLKLRANAAAKTDPSLTPIRDELRLYDLRGTAATALLRAGCSLHEIAITMGWGLRHAANIIEKYAALVPEVSDEVLEKLRIARDRARADADRSKQA
jgi:integrase